MEKTFDTPGPLALTIEIPAGEVVLEAVPGGRTELELEGLDAESRRLLDEVRVELRDSGAGHELLVQAPKRTTWGFSFGRSGYTLRVRCPEGATVRVRTKSADVAGHGRLGSADVATASGDVALEQVDGDAQVKTASGDVEIGRVSGRATAHSASGDIELGSVRGRLAANTVSGDLSVADAGADVTVNTVSGDLELDAVREGAVQAQSVSGDVAIGVRRGSRVYLDCNTLSGDTSSELELSGEPVAEEGPLVELRAKTVSGDIRIVRAPAPTEEVHA